MSSNDDPGAALLAAARKARDICAYIASFPDDASVRQPLREAASAIAAAAGKTKNRVLSELSSQFTKAAAVTITSEKGVRKLQRILTQILLIAEQMALEDPMSRENRDGSIQGPREPILPEILPRWKTR